VSIAVSVRDTGEGIPAHLQDQLFRRFTQINPTPARRRQGSGLGLPIALRLSRLLGGSLGVESAAGRGSTFTFDFTASLPPARLSHDRLAGSLSGLRVATFADRGIVGRQLASLLGEWRVETVAAPPPAVAATPSIDAIIVDTGSPAQVERSGQLAARLPHVPVIALTRLGMHGSAAGASSHRRVATPVRAEALHAALRSAGLHGGGVAAPVPAGTPGRPASRGPGALTVLLVDDNDANRRVIRLMLEELGLRVDDAGSGSEAVARAGRRAYDVILMDVRMPDLDGLEATRRIRAAHAAGRPAPIILALTANAIQGEADRCRVAGMNGYLAKPLRLETLATALAAHTSGPETPGAPTVH
jgi:CheY-like chemotaxis protein